MARASVTPRSAHDPSTSDVGSPGPRATATVRAEGSVASAGPVVVGITAVHQRAPRGREPEDGSRGALEHRDDVGLRGRPGSAVNPAQAQPGKVVAPVVRLLCGQVVPPREVDEIGQRRESGLPHGLPLVPAHVQHAARPVGPHQRAHILQPRTVGAQQTALGEHRIGMHPQIRRDQRPARHQHHTVCVVRGEGGEHLVQGIDRVGESARGIGAGDARPTAHGPEAGQAQGEEIDGSEPQAVRRDLGDQVVRRDLRELHPGLPSCREVLGDHPRRAGGLGHLPAMAIAVRILGQRQAEVDVGAGRRRPLQGGGDQSLLAGLVEQGGHPERVRVPVGARRGRSGGEGMLGGHPGPSGRGSRDQGEQRRDGLGGAARGDLQARGGARRPLRHAPEKSPAQRCSLGEVGEVLLVESVDGDDQRAAGRHKGPSRRDRRTVSRPP